MPPIHNTPQYMYNTIPPNACIPPPLHETFDALICSNNSVEASTSMSHRFGLSHSIPLPNIITNFFLKCGPIQMIFFSTHIWDLILAGNLCAAPLYPTQAQVFSPLLTLLLEPDHISKLATYPDLPVKSIASFQDVLRFINGCKCFLVSVCHTTYYSSTISSQDLSLLEYKMTDSNLAAR